MGSWLSSLFTWTDKEVRLLILGLDASGKSTLLYRIQHNQTIPTVPTIGFNVEEVKQDGLKIKLWDLGGQKSLIPFWRNFFDGADALIFVIDSTDHERLNIAKKELFSLLDEPELKDAILCILANKQDLPNALSDVEISNRMGLAKIRNRNWTVFKTSALKGTNVKEAFSWLSQQIKAKK